MMSFPTKYNDIFARIWRHTCKNMTTNSSVLPQPTKSVLLFPDALEVVQSRGVCNKNTEYHEQIVNLVNANRGLISRRMKATA